MFAKLKKKIKKYQVHVTWMWKRNMNIGTWNVRSLFWPEALTVLHNELSKTDRKQINTFERKVYRRIMGSVYDNEKENWRILTNKEIYAMVKKPIITETIRLNRLRWFGHAKRMEENRIPQKVLYMNLEATRLKGRPTVQFLKYIFFKIL